MSETPHVPRSLIDGGEMPASRGSFDGSWLIEETAGNARLGLRVERLLHEEKTRYQHIAIYDSPFFGRILTLDGIVMLTERDEFVYHEMLAHVPLCAIERPRAVLVIGGGDCGVAREVLKHATIERVVQCDVDERVTRVCEQHFPWVREVEADPRTELVFDDGVAYVDAHAGEFDLVVVDSTDPKGCAVELFSRSFYAKVGRALKPGGVMTAQTESPHWDANMVSSIYAEMRAPFRHVSAYLCMVPTYPSGCFSLAFASDGDVAARLDVDRAHDIGLRCRYYDPDVHRAAFALPRFARRVIEDGDNSFERFDARVRVRPGA